MKVNSHPTLSIPRNFTFLSIPTIFIHPNDCSTRLRFRWLTSYPACRVVRSSTALLRFVSFCATCGVMFIPRSSRTNSCVS